MSTPLRTVTSANGDPLAEAIDLTKRLKLPHIRRSLSDIIPTAKAQRWDPAEVVRVLLAEEAAGRDRANLHTRRKTRGFPYRQDLRRLGRNEIVDSPRHPGRAPHPGVGRAA